MSERLSEEFMRQMQEFANELMDGQVVHGQVARIIKGAMVAALIEENRSLRASTLTAEEGEALRKVYVAAKTWCETLYVGKPHPKYPAYPHDELLVAVNGIRIVMPELDDKLLAAATEGRNG